MMGSKWRDITLGDFITLQRGHDLTEIDRRPGKIPVMGSAGHNGNHDTALVKGPGIVVGRSGASFGQVHLCEVDYWPHNTGLYVTDFKGNDAHFAYYLLKATNFSRYNSGSAQPSLNRNFIYPINIRIPPVAEQRAIAGVLRCLDDKIELNRKMNETLEQMAQAIFKSWFIDFDGHTEFEDSELGRIPKGWSVGTLNSWAQIIMGSSPSSASYNTVGQGYPLVNGPVEFGAYFPVQSKWTSEPTRLSETGDLIFCVRGSTTGRSVKSDGTYCLGRGVCGIRAKHQRFVDACVSAHLPRLLERATGSVFPNLGTADLNSFKVVSPPKAEVERYEATVSPLLLRVEANHRETCTLADLRDTLLPRLISGHLRVKNIEKLSEQTE